MPETWNTKGNPVACSLTSTRLVAAHALVADISMESETSTVLRASLRPECTSTDIAVHGARL